MPYQRDVSGTDGVADKAHMAPKVTLSMDDGLEVVLLRTSGEIMDSMHHLSGEYVASATTLSDYLYLLVLCEENLVRIQNTQIHGCVHIVPMRNVLIMEVHRLQAAPAGFAKGKVATHVLYR